MAKPTVYIPNFNGGERLLAALASIHAQDVDTACVIADNGSSDGSTEKARELFPEFEVLDMGDNLGFGPALNRAVAMTDGDPVILLNNDAEAQPGFVAALLRSIGEGADAVAAVLVSERDPSRIDSAGVIADRTLMGFDYLNGEPLATAASAPAPLGPTGGAAAYTRAAFEQVGGFDERIFLYYEDLDLALRMRRAGLVCKLAPDAIAVHAYSESLGARTGAKYERTGWSRGYLLRRYGVMGSARAGARVLALEGTICAGQLVRDRTLGGLKGRLRGWREGRGVERIEAPADGLLDLSAREALSLRQRRHSG